MTKSVGFEQKMRLVLVMLFNKKYQTLKVTFFFEKSNIFINPLFARFETHQNHPIYKQILSSGDYMCKGSSYVTKFNVFPQ